MQHFHFIVEYEASNDTLRIEFNTNASVFQFLQLAAVFLQRRRVSSEELMLNLATGHGR